MGERPRRPRDSKERPYIWSLQRMIYMFVKGFQGRSNWKAGREIRSGFGGKRALKGDDGSWEWRANGLCFLQPFHYL
jgi:hypothetical protein